MDTARWFTELVHDCFTQPMNIAARRLVRDDIEYVSDFWNRLDAAGKKAGITPVRTDITARHKKGGWRINPYAVVVVIQNNIFLFRKISAFSDCVAWYDKMMDYVARQHEIEGSQWMTAEQKVLASRVLWDAVQPELSYFVSKARGE